MGYKISKEQIDPGVKDHIMSFVGDVNELETDEKSNIIDAVNSLIVDRVDNAENMGKLANAIGEPITANHSVNEVVEGLGEMLSTFKTNMMNNGVVVESGDKFKQLIDKLATLSDSEGSDIQFSTGFINKTSLAGESNTNWVRNPMTFDTPLPFTPTRVIVSLPDVGMNTDISGNYYIGNISVDSLLCFDDNVSDELSMYDVHGDRVYLYITNITNDGFDLYARKTSSNNPLGTPRGIYWCAIGVGEEDTTLRDSLADILENKGVDVTEEDDMASLITKVDSIQTGGGLDIISATELPANGRENQICVITENPTDRILMSPVLSDISSDTEAILVELSTKQTAKQIICNNNKFMSYYYINNFGQNNSVLPSYIYKNGSWDQFTSNIIYLMQDGKIVTEPFGGIDIVSNYSSHMIIATDHLRLCPTSEYTLICVSSLNAIDFTLFNKCVIKVYTTGTAYYCRLYTGMSTVSVSGGYTGGTSSVSNATFVSSQDMNSKSETEFTFDISSLSGTGYLTLGAYKSGTGFAYITEVYLY